MGRNFPSLGLNLGIKALPNLKSKGPTNRREVLYLLPISKGISWDEILDPFKDNVLVPSHSASPPTLSITSISSITALTLGTLFKTTPSLENIEAYINFEARFLAPETFTEPIKGTPPSIKIEDIFNSAIPQLKN
jgi:hypothetical protein